MAIPNGLQATSCNTLGAHRHWLYVPHSLLWYSSQTSLNGFSTLQCKSTIWRVETSLLMTKIAGSTIFKIAREAYKKICDCNKIPWRLVSIVSTQTSYYGIYNRLAKKLGELMHEKWMPFVARKPYSLAHFKGESQTLPQANWEMWEVMHAAMPWKRGICLWDSTSLANERTSHSLAGC